MIEKYLEIIAELDICCECERSPEFINEVSRIAYERYDLNAADSSSTHDSLCAALDQYFN